MRPHKEPLTDCARVTLTDCGALLRDLTSTLTRRIQRDFESVARRLGAHAQRATSPGAMGRVSLPRSVRSGAPRPQERARHRPIALRVLGQIARSASAR